MSEINVTFAQYLLNPMTSEVSSIRATIDGQDLFVPLDPANRHYAEIMRKVDAGELVIAAASE